jgi:hypothetical protein
MRLMRKRKKNRHKKIILKKPALTETLFAQTGNIPLNIAKTDRISFSVLRNKDNRLTKIENISYEVLIDYNWEWVVRLMIMEGKEIYTDTIGYL